MNESQPVRVPRVLHVTVGHGLPTYFMNAVRSVRATAPTDQLLIIDNASPGDELRDKLSHMADKDDHVDVIFRTANDVQRNRKVGSLYDAYETAFEYAIAHGFDLLHLIQADFQMLWWDTDVITRAVEIFSSHPHCVNILTQFLQRNKRLTDELELSGVDGLTKLRKYGITDTGLYHLHRWKAEGMRFGASEQSHAKRYLDEGLEVLCHPWPTDAPIPWPAVVRNGVRRGKEIATGKPYLLKPLSPEDAGRLKVASKQIWLEDVCIPWGWVCLTPMWTTDVDSIDYWVARYRDAKRNGLASALPRLELRGVSREDLRRPATYRYRPSLFRLFIAAPTREVTRRVAHLR